MTTKTTKNAPHRESMSETEALRSDLDQTRQHLADTVQQLGHQLNVPQRLKQSAGEAGHRMQARMKGMPDRMKEVPSRMRDVPGQVKDLPAASLRHPKVMAAVAGVVALCVGAAAWMARNNK
jgi:hypothetical protein